MPAPKGGRRQPRMPRMPRMPNLNLSRQQLQQTESQADPASPPHTPTASPKKSRKIQPVFVQPVFAEASRRGPRDPRIYPVGNGHQFSYQPFVGPEQFSPRSPSSSEAPDDSDDEYSSEEEEYQTGPIKAPSPLAASDAQSSQDAPDTDEDEDEEGDEVEEEKDDDEELQDVELQANAAKQSISPIGRVGDMEDDDEEEEEEDEELSDAEPRIHATNRFACLYGRAAEMEDEEEREEDDDEELQDSDMEKYTVKPYISPIGRAVQMEDGSDEEDEDEEDQEREDDDYDEDEEEEVDNEKDADGMSRPTVESPVYATTTTTATTTIFDFVLEEMDPMDSDNGLSVLDPYEIESNCSRSSSKYRDDDPPTFEHRELPIRVMQDLKNLHCSNEASDEEAEQNTEEAAFYKWQQHLRRRRLSISSSITGKRTFSERSDSDDSDDAGLDVNEVGSSARRMRKRMHRGSLLFQDPPEPRIDELEEPNSSEDEFLPTQRDLGMDLPSWTIEINEMEDSQ